MTIGAHARDPRDAAPAAGTDAPLPHETVAFAHNSERQFAKLLDFYEIEWEYEPTTFEIEWDRDGNATQRFSPDFYLPAFDLYIEITTLNQKLVTKKNRKVRRLMTLYPDVRCKVLYQRDYLNLLVKYGLEEPSQGSLLGAAEPAAVDVVRPSPGERAGEPPLPSGLGSALAG
ncbi:MAG TPA: hypothetical protein VHJ34_04985 [Actinomycetota bacterium]|nr:hypothetical protein [Actinomycetota bacterium]